MNNFEVLIAIDIAKILKFLEQPPIKLWNGMISLPFGLNEINALWHMYSKAG
jgi:hypothetical protein